MFLDTSVIIAILAAEDDGPEWSRRMGEAKTLVTSPLVVLEATMVLSTRHIVDPVDTEKLISDFLLDSKVVIIPSRKPTESLRFRRFGISARAGASRRS